MLGFYLLVKQKVQHQQQKRGHEKVSPREHVFNLLPRHQPHHHKVCQSFEFSQPCEVRRWNYFKRLQKQNDRKRVAQIGEQEEESVLQRKQRRHKEGS